MHAGLSTARRSARLRSSEESEVVSAGGQKVAIRLGQIRVEEEASCILPPQLPDPKRLPGGFITFHAVGGDERPLEGAQGIVPRHPVENLRQAGAGVDVGMERIAPPATACVGAGSDRLRDDLCASGLQFLHLPPRPKNEKF